MFEILMWTGFGALMVGGTAFAIVWGRKEWRESCQRWRVVSTRLGASFDRGPHSDRPMYGDKFADEAHVVRNDRHVYLGIRSYMRDDMRDTYTYVDVPFDESLKLGLTIGDLGRSFIGRRGSDDQYGLLPELQYVDACALDRRQLEALLTDDVRRRLDHAGYVTFVTDDKVRLEGSQYAKADDVRVWIDEAVALHDAVWAAWQTLPRSETAEMLAPTWRKVADRHKLTFGRHGLHMTRDLGRGATLWVEAALGWSAFNRVRWATVVEVRFESPLDQPTLGSAARDAIARRVEDVFVSPHGIGGRIGDLVTSHKLLGELVTAVTEAGQAVLEANTGPRDGAYR